MKRIESLSVFNQNLTLDSQTTLPAACDDCIHSVMSYIWLTEVNTSKIKIQRINNKKD